MSDMWVWASWSEVGTGEAGSAQGSSWMEMVGRSGHPARIRFGHSLPQMGRASRSRTPFGGKVS